MAEISERNLSYYPEVMDLTADAKSAKHAAILGLLGHVHAENLRLAARTKIFTRSETSKSTGGTEIPLGGEHINNFGITYYALLDLEPDDGTQYEVRCQDPEAPDRDSMVTMNGGDILEFAPHESPSLLVPQDVNRPRRLIHAWAILPDIKLISANEL